MQKKAIQKGKKNLDSVAFLEEKALRKEVGHHKNTR